MAHQHEWIQASVEGHSTGGCSGKLLSVTEYCECGAVARNDQSATDADWHRTIASERIVLDEDGTLLGAAWAF